MNSVKKIKLEPILDANKELLFDLMEKNKIGNFEVRFDGGGDDGQIDSIDLPDKFLSQTVLGGKISNGSLWNNGKPTVSWKYDPKIEEIIENICYETLELHHSGWEDGDGSRGGFLFDVKSRTVFFQFDERFYDYETHKYKF
jgi:hypothetical protein